MTEINHEIFGKLVFDHYWKKEHEIEIFNQKRIVTILIDGEDDADFEQAQQDAFIKFFSQKDKLVEQAENEISKYYKGVCMEYRLRLGDKVADKIAPIVNDKLELATLVELKSLIFPWTFDDDKRIVGMLFNSSWEPEHGIAVKFENENIIEVGYQDIVL